MINKVFITGVSGFIGSRLSRFLLEKGYRVVGLSRNPQDAAASVDKRVELYQWLGDKEEWSVLLDDQSAFIHLAGRSISALRWTPQIKQTIIQSRVLTGKYLIDLFRRESRFPAKFLQTSATGYYGNRGNEIVDEASAAGEGFLAEASRQWEQSTQALEEEAVRRSIMRIGMVLSSDGGALPQLMLPYRFFMGARMGGGQQGMPWIHLNDVLRAMEYLLSREDNRGVYNLTAPIPVSNYEFCKTLGKVLKRPCLLRIPAFLLKLGIGEMARELILNGSYVQPAALQKSGFKFEYRELRPALENLLNR